ncbi:MAG TPA: UbiA family prenyltransferase [Puia sp.]|nr:UbiA family prenyltransferase [Puia sp.]
MMTKEETDFIRYWEANRLKRKKLSRQLLVGIPAGLLITVPIVINLTSGWYKRATMEMNSSDFNPMVLIVALLIIVAFSAIFWQRHQWDQYEQRYLELLIKRDREEDRQSEHVEARSGPDEGDDPGAKQSPGENQGS